MMPPTDRNNGLFIAICTLLFALFFSFILHQDWSLIFKKDLYFHDESVNSVVAANITRKFFPAMVRVNPLSEQPASWMEGPYWQHIPPLFTYIPYPFFKIDGHVTIEIKRLAYAMVILLTGIIFILTVGFYEKTAIATLSAAIAAILFICTRFTRDLITGIEFGTSDIILAFTAICSFAAVCWYLGHPRHERRQYPLWTFVPATIVLTMPILAKNVLGAIPVTTFLALILADHRKINRRVLIVFLSFMVLVALYFVPLYWISPATFREALAVPAAHAGDYEGWARPWYVFFVDYIPHRYAVNLALPYGMSVLLGIYYLLARLKRSTAFNVLALSGGWFLWNLCVVSVIRSKAPNFIFQTYLLSLFFAVYPLLLIISDHYSQCEMRTRIEKIWRHDPHIVYRSQLAVFMVLLVLVVTVYFALFADISRTRAAAYSYDSIRERFYRFGEVEQRMSADSNDIFVFNSSPSDCWLRYYVLFLTGSEARTFDEMLSYGAPVERLRGRYRRLYFVVSGVNTLPDIQIPHDVQDLGDFKVFVFKTADLNQEYLRTLTSAIYNSSVPVIFSSRAGCPWMLRGVTDRTGMH